MPETDDNSEPTWSDWLAMIVIVIFLALWIDSICGKYAC